MNARQWGDLLYIALALGMVLLGGLFLGATRWWSDPIGRSLAAFFAAVILIMTWGGLVVAGILPRDAAWLYPARSILFGLLGCTVWGMLIGFIRVQFFSRSGRPRWRKRD